MYIIPSEINTETKLTKNIYIIDMIFIVVSFFLTITFSAAVNPKVVIFYYVFSGILTLFLIMKSVSNPGMRNYKAIYLFLVRNRKVYQSLDWNTERELKNEE